MREAGDKLFGQDDIAGPLFDAEMCRRARVDLEVECLRAEGKV